MAKFRLCTYGLMEQARGYGARQKLWIQHPKMSKVSLLYSLLCVSIGQKLTVKAYMYSNVEVVMNKI